MHPNNGSAPAEFEGTEREERRGGGDGGDGSKRGKEMIAA